MPLDQEFALSLKPSPGFRAPPESDLVELVTVVVDHPIEGLDTIHKVDALGVWCSDGDILDAKNHVSGNEFAFRLSLIPWSRVRRVDFTAAT